MNKMKLVLSTLAISLSFSWHTPVSRAASGDVQASFPVFPVTVNGTVMDVTHSEYPLLVYNDITYFPMTWNNTASLGLSVNWSADSGLSIQKKDGCVPLEQNLATAVNSNDYRQTASLAPFPVKVNGRQIVNSNEPYPVLFYRDITYFPMTWKFTHDDFGWNTSWDSVNGYAINSCGGVSNTQLQQTNDLNIANGGQLAVQGDWIYMNPASKYQGPNQLVKVKKDGSGEIKLSDDNARNINIVGDWLYYTADVPSQNNMNGIFKIKTDGTQRTQVSSVPSGQMWVQDGWIYYVSQTYNQTEAVSGGYYMSTGIHKMKLDGSGDQELAAGSQVYRFFLTANRIFFNMQEQAEQNSNMYSMNLDGSNLKNLQGQGNITQSVVIDGWVYYVVNFGKQLNKMSLDGSVVIPLYTSDNYIASLQYRQGWIYMVNGSFGIHGSAALDKLRLDGTELTELAMARATALYFADKTLYFPQSYMGDNRLEHMDVE